MRDERARLLACLAAERSELLCQLLGLDRRALTEERFLDRWTVKDCLAHIGAWDRWEHEQMRRALSGDPPADVAVDLFNAAVVAEACDRSLSEIVAEVRAARAGWAAWLRGLSDDAFFQSRPFGDWDWAFARCLRIQWEHDAEHAAQIGAWREARGWERDVAPKCVLLAALEAAREELLTACDLVPEDDRSSRAVCGVWTLKDVVGHLADWEEVGVAGLHAMAQGEPVQVEHVTDIDRWNHEHAEARRGEPWEQVWDDLHTRREALVGILDGTEQADLERSYSFPWGPEGTAYTWVAVFAAHDREHAEGIRQVVIDRGPT